MVTVYDLKPKFQKLLQPIMQYLFKKRISPNFITSLALLGSFLVGATIVIFKDRRTLLILPFWLFIRMALNAIDGMLARQFNLSSSLGAVLNETGDILSDIFLYASLAFFLPTAVIPICLFVLIAVLTEFCGVLAQTLGANRRYDGPMGKSDRAFLVGILASITFISPSLTSFWGYIFYAAFFLGLLTFWNRLYQGYLILKEKEIK